jgi:hypothetical protein
VRHHCGLVQTNPAASILATAEDFTILQRLFRLIFDGQLRGPQLLRQVADLATQLGLQIDDAVPTSRWNTSENLLGVREAQSIGFFYEDLGIEAAPKTPAAPEVATALTILAACAQAAKSPDSLVSAAAWQSHRSLEKVREPLATSCRESGTDGAKSLVCRLADVAAFSEAAFAEIKLAEMIGIPTTPTQQPTPKVCRPGP